MKAHNFINHSDKYEVYIYKCVCIYKYITRSLPLAGPRIFAIFLSVSLGRLVAYHKLNFLSLSENRAEDM